MMINDQKYKIQEEKKEVKQEGKEEKIDWQEKVKRESPYDWPECLAAIQTAENIIRTEEQNPDINWKKVYQACQVTRYSIFSSVYNKKEVASINQCYRQFIREKESTLENIYYFCNTRSNHITLNGLLAKLKNANCNLISLNFENERLGDAGAKEIANALKSEHCKFTSLNIRYNQIGVAGVKEIAIALQSEHCQLTLLNLSWNQIGIVGAKEIAIALKSEHCKLTSLNLWKNQIGEAGAQEIATALKSKHCKLTLLNLENNQIGDVGAKEIAIALKSEYCQLMSLNFGRNRIGVEGAKEIADTLKSEHCELTSLNLENNQIGDAGAKEIANALKSEQCKLKSLDLWGNQIGETGKLAIALVLKDRHCSRDLHIELDSDVKEYILKFNEEWEQAQASYTILTHPDKNSQLLSVLHPDVTIKVLFPYLFDIFKDELKPVTEQKRVEIPTYAHDEQGKIKTQDGKPIVIESSWELRDIPTDELEEPQSQVGNCFLENHSEHFKIMQAKKQNLHAAEFNRQEAETQTVYKCVIL